MKNLLKIGALSLALIATVFMLNANAQVSTGDLTFEITGLSGVCNLGSGADLGDYAFDINAQIASGDFVAADASTTWYCDDSAGSTPWRVDVSSTAVENITTINSAHTIPNTNVYIIANTATQVFGSGVCSQENGGSLNGTREDLSTAQTLFGKTSAIGEVCAIEATNVRLETDLAGSQALGQYLGTLTIDLIDFQP